MVDGIDWIYETGYQFQNEGSDSQSWIHHLWTLRGLCRLSWYHENHGEYNFRDGEIRWRKLLDHLPFWWPKESNLRVWLNPALPENHHGRRVWENPGSETARNKPLWNWRNLKNSWLYLYRKQKLLNALQLRSQPGSLVSSLGSFWKWHSSIWYSSLVTHK